jgi:sec-independent protein translocase protein TatA
MFAGHLPELIVLLVAALVIFGPKRLPEIGSAMGKGIREFRKSTTEEEGTSGDQQVATAEKPPQIASAPPTVEATPVPTSTETHDVGAAAASSQKPDVH